LREVVQMALGGGEGPGGLPFEGVQAEGWIGDFLAQLEGKEPFEELPPPPELQGTLRPYQVRGYSWLAFLGRWGLGACLADDMGLGKTVQALALIERLWHLNPRPTLLICPTSVVANWKKEAERFTPELPVLIHHGGGRTKGAAFAKQVEKYALVLSSYSLLHRDRELFEGVSWGAVVLDEAQNIKNPQTKQSQAARAIKADRRIALTGTPVENHVGDLWSILEFLNPGWLGSLADFRKRFFIPIQAQQDAEAAARLKRLTTPFILRRLKTDKTIIADLPEKLEMKVYCNLTREQATLYAAVVAEAEAALKEAEGIGRKGVILATLTRLKQVCNHPAHYLGDGSAIPDRSGKLARLTEMLEEVFEAGEKALVFTQFTEMGEILKRHLQDTFAREVLFLHGGTPREHRTRMVERFQAPEGPRAFLLSLKAGGTGLNLTAATHVFHFDRWWNPAVEDQATDRAFRIGQQKNVQVHKFVCAGTVEEKIDDMIERKQQVASRVVSVGEGWLTELSNDQLRDLFALRQDAIGD
jgi:SNF2 family DNA or RNA helicase